VQQRGWVTKRLVSVAAAVVDVVVAVDVAVVGGDVADSSVAWVAVVGNWWLKCDFGAAAAAAAAEKEEE